MDPKEHSQEFPDCFYRVTIKGMCVRDGRVLLIKEPAELSGKWEMPGGGLDFGEDIREGFKREVQEEMGLKVSKMSERPIYVWTHKYTDKRGLEWFYSLVLAYRIEFEDLEFTATEECESISFHSKKDMKGLQLSGQMQEFKDIFDPTDFKEEF